MKPINNFGDFVQTVSAYNWFFMTHIFFSLAWLRIKIIGKKKKMDNWSLRRENNSLTTDKVGFDLLSTHLTLITKK